MSEVLYEMSLHRPSTLTTLRLPFNASPEEAAPGMLSPRWLKAKRLLFLSYPGWVLIDVRKAASNV